MSKFVYHDFMNHTYQILTEIIGNIQIAFFIEFFFVSFSEPTPLMDAWSPLYISGDTKTYMA